MTAEEYIVSELKSAKADLEMKEILLDLCEKKVEEYKKILEIIKDHITFKENSVSLFVYGCGEEEKKTISILKNCFCEKENGNANM